MNALRTGVAIAISAVSAALCVVGLTATLLLTGASGFLGLLINPHGGLYGGSQAERDTAFAVAGGGACASVAFGLGILLSLAFGIAAVVRAARPSESLTPRTGSPPPER